MRLAFLLSLVVTSASLAQPAGQRGEIEPKVAQAWKRAQAEVGWYGNQDGDWVFFAEKPKDVAVLPAIRCPVYVAGMFAKLPEPATPFALDCRPSDERERDEGFHRVPRGVNPYALGRFKLTITDTGLKELATLKNLRSLNLASTQVTGAGLKELAAIKNLRSLNLANTHVTGAGLKELAAIKNLEALTLPRPTFEEGVLQLHHRVGDEDLKGLAGLTNLQFLSANFSNVTDDGLKHLAGLKNLQTLYLYVTKVTGVGFKELAKRSEAPDPEAVRERVALLAPHSPRAACPRQRPCRVRNLVKVD
jgi:internalin A